MIHNIATFRINNIIATVSIPCDDYEPAEFVHVRLAEALRQMAAQGPERMSADRTGERTGNDKG